MESQARNNTPYFTQKSGRGGGGGGGDADEGDNNLAKAVNSDGRAGDRAPLGPSLGLSLLRLRHNHHRLGVAAADTPIFPPLTFFSPFYLDRLLDRVEARDGLIANQQGYL